LGDPWSCPINWGIPGVNPSGFYFEIKNLERKKDEKC